MHKYFCSAIDSTILGYFQHTGERGEKAKMYAEKVNQEIVRTLNPKGLFLNYGSDFFPADLNRETYKRSDRLSKFTK